MGMLAIHFYVTVFPSISFPRSVYCHRLCVLFVWSVHRLFIRSLNNLNELSIISVPFLIVSFSKLFKLCIESFEFNKLFHTHILLIIGFCQFFHCQIESVIEFIKLWNWVETIIISMPIILVCLNYF